MGTRFGVSERHMRRRERPLRQTSPGELAFARLDMALGGQYAIIGSPSDKGHGAGAVYELPMN